MMMLIKVESPSQRDTITEALNTAGLKHEDISSDNISVIKQALCLYKQKCLLNIEAVKDKTGTRLLTEFFTKRINTTEQLINQLR